MIKQREFKLTKSEKDLLFPHPMVRNSIGNSGITTVLNFPIPTNAAEYLINNGQMSLQNLYNGSDYYIVKIKNTYYIHKTWFTSWRIDVLIHVQNDCEFAVIQARTLATEIKMRYAFEMHELAMTRLKLGRDNWVAAIEY